MHSRFIRCPLCNSDRCTKRYYIEEGYEVEFYINCYRCGYHEHMIYSLHESTFSNRGLLGYIISFMYVIMNPRNMINIIRNRYFKLNRHIINH